MPLEDLRELFGTSNRVDQIIVQVEEGEDVLVVADRVEKKLMKTRDVTEKTKDFIITTPEELLKSFQTILNIITVFLAGIAAISLFVGGVGIANTMYTSVIERTREIGVMKAIGARNSDVLSIFLIESGLLGLVGGIVGALIGLGGALGISKIANQVLGADLFIITISWPLLFGAVAFAFIIGVVSGVLPALQASKLNVVEALRK